MESLPNRFWSKVDIKYSEDCWVWQGCREKVDYGDGLSYGRLNFRGRLQLAHRVSWFLKTGEFPQLFVLHKCDNAACVNPRHLYLGTHADNMRDMSKRNRARGAKQVLCKRGHPLSGDNLRMEKRPRGKAARICKACLRDKRQESWYANHEANKTKGRMRYHTRKSLEV